jgi:microcin C transport system permease protein
MKTVLAKGLSFRYTLVVHAFRNSLVPIASTMGHGLSLFLAGSFIIEKIFNINGMGQLGVEALMDRDYPLVMGIILISSTLQLLGNVLSDFCVAIIDPRVRYL